MRLDCKRRSSSKDRGLPLSTPFQDLEGLAHSGRGTVLSFLSQNGICRSRNSLCAAVLQYLRHCRYAAAAPRHLSGQLAHDMGGRAACWCCPNHEPLCDAPIQPGSSESRAHRLPSVAQQRSPCTGQRRASPRRGDASTQVQRPLPFGSGRSWAMVCFQPDLPYCWWRRYTLTFERPDREKKRDYCV